MASARADTACGHGHEYPRCVAMHGGESTLAVQVRCVSPDPTGQWLLTGSDDGSMRLWEALTGRCCREWRFGGRVAAVAWCPDPSLRLASAAVSNRLVLVDSGVGPSAAREAAAAALTAPEADAGAAAVAARWVAGEHGGLDVCHNHQLRGLHWHGRCGSARGSMCWVAE